MQLVPDDMSMSDVEWKRVRARIEADHDDSFTVRKRESDFVPYVWIIGCDISKTDLSILNAFFYIINHDGGARVLVNAVGFKTCFFDCRDQNIPVAFVVWPAIVKWLNDEACWHGGSFAGDGL